MSIMIGFFTTVLASKLFSKSEDALNDMPSENVGGVFLMGHGD